MSKNYKISKIGFTVKDNNTNHILKVKFENDIYHGVVLMPEQNEQISLASWTKGENPFQNDISFEGKQSGYSPDGYWWFHINPSSPFSKIMSEVEFLNNNVSFLKKLFRPKIKTEFKLFDFVNKTNQTGYMFADIINDLGESVESIINSSKLIQMSYAYARRSAATALYLQGLIDVDIYDHNLSFFKAMQLKTEHSVHFQEKSFSNSVEYMQTYNPIITRMLIKNMAVIAQNFEIPTEKLSDKEFIEILMNAYSV